ncbi:hypothetical protein [Ornithinibacillus xuwenensis]|uniref:WYL domain-containing protein n=1 Tax=Ornithinibacillus xuwenensis TaxID=3144668 RepID=A0ABU9XEV3_9BACI
MKGLMARSIESKEKIVIFYIDRNNNITQRYIRIISFDEETVIAFCFWRKKIRNFKMKNILSAGPIKNRMGA